MALDAVQWEEAPLRRCWPAAGRAAAGTLERGRTSNMTVQDTTATGVILSDPAAAKVKALLDQ